MRRQALMLAPQGLRRISMTDLETGCESSKATGPNTRAA